MQDLNNLSTFELANSVFHCSRFNGDAIEFLEKVPQHLTYSVKFVGFNMLLNKEESVKRLFELEASRMDMFLKDYPSQIETLIKLSNFRARASIWSDSDNYKKVFEANYKVLITEVKNREEIPVETIEVIEPVKKISKPTQQKDLFDFL